MKQKQEKDIIRVLVQAGQQDLAQTFARSRGYRVTAAAVPDINSPVYHEVEKAKGFNSPVSPLHSAAAGQAGGRMLIARLPNFKKGDHASAAKKHRGDADKKDKQWGKLWNTEFEKQFGHPPQMWDYKVSGIGSDELPEKVKTKLRKLAHEAGWHRAAAESHDWAAKYGPMR